MAFQPLSLESSVRYIKGVGPKRAILFDKLSIKTISDLLNHFPFRIQDFSNIKPIDTVKPQEEVTVVGKVFSHGFTKSQKGFAFRVGISDGKGALYLVWYNMPYMKRLFRKSQFIIASGKVEWRRNSLEIAHPLWKETEPDLVAGKKGPIIPVYHGTSSLQSNQIHLIIKGFLESNGTEIDDDVPFPIREKYDLLSLSEAYKEMHLPKNAVLWEKARRTLGFREMLYLQIGLLLMRKENQEVRKPLKFTDFSLADKFLDMLPFHLTSAQIRAISDIRQDLSSGRLMNRMLQGDVGSGKTVVAMWALLASVSNGYQGAFLVPTEILASQHFSTFEKMCPHLAQVALVTGSLGASDREKSLEAISTGKQEIVIGTHALLEPSVKWNRLGLVVTDEQHRFGVRQRLHLAEEGAKDSSTVPHILVMSATPIPRSLALTFFGDMDISVIDSLPQGRKKIKTRVLSENEREIAYERIRQEVSQGKKAYVVCPLIREGKTGRKSAEELFKELKVGFLKGIEIGLIHGDMPKDKISETMTGFVKGDISVLVATTVIEVGIDVEDATCMVVEDAGSFGLADLHQLRGRVGRGSAESFCFFIVPNDSDNGSNYLFGSGNRYERVQKLETLDDGFSVAELDLSTRGPGQFFGKRQHGLTEFNMQDLGLSVETIIEAREAAKDILSSKNHDCQNLVSKVKARFGDLALNSLSR